MSLRFELIDSFERFLQLREPWNELAAHSGADHAFMRHEWFECWIKNLGNQDNLRIHTLWSDGQLMAVAPMQITRERLKGFPLKALRFLSSAISPRCNFIVHDSCDPEQLFAEIFRRKNWDLTITDNIEADIGVTSSYLEFLGSNRIRHMVETGRLSPYVLTETGWDEFWNGLAKSFRRNLIKSENRLRKEKSFEIRRFTDYGKLPAILGRLAEISAKSWKGDAGSDLKSDKRLLSFYSDFSNKGLDAELFELWVMEIEDRIIAFDYHLRGKNSLSAIRSDYDIAYKYYSPGHIIKFYLLKDLFDRDGVWEYDLGGQLAEYKMKWAKQLRKHLNITASNSGFYGNFLVFGKASIMPFIRKCLKRRGGASPPGDPGQIAE